MSIDSWNQRKQATRFDQARAAGAVAAQDPKLGVEQRFNDQLAKTNFETGEGIQELGEVLKDVPLNRGTPWYQMRDKVVGILHEQTKGDEDAIRAIGEKLGLQEGDVTDALRNRRTASAG